MEQQSQLAPSINLLDVLRGIGRHKLLISIITLAALVGSIAFVTKSKNLYSTEAQLLIENLASPFDRAQTPDDQRNEAIDDRIILSQLSVLKSDDLGIRVINALKLQERDEFDPLKSDGLGLLKSLLLSLGFGEDPRLMTPEQRALRRYSNELLVYQIPESNVLAVKYSANDPKTAAEVANTLVKLFVSSTAETKLKPTTRAREWIGGQIDELRNKLASSEAAIESFRAQAGLLKGSTTTLGTQELSELNSQITLAETARTEAEERAKSINDMLATKGTVDESIDVLNSPNVQRMREQQVSVARLVAELSATYLPNHPKMIAAQNQLTNIDRQIRKEALKVVQGLDEQARIASARENSLRARLEEMKGSATTANQDEVKLQAMVRDAAADKVLLESLLLRYADASTRQNIATQPGIARIIQEASAPTSPSFPKPGPMVLLSTLAGLAFSLALSFLLEIMGAANQLPQPDTAVNVPPKAVQDPVFERTSIPTPPAQPRLLEPLTGFPSTETPLGNMDLLDQSKVHDTFGLLAASRKIAEWAFDLHKSSTLRQLAILSLDAGPADSSLATVVVARALAAKYARVIVVDLAANGSSVDMFFGLQHGPGFIDLLAGAADFTKVITRDPESSAHYMRFGFAKNEASLSLLTQRMDAVLNALGTIYDLVIIHAGEASSRTPTLVSKCQAALILAPAKRQLDATKAAQNLSSDGRVNVQLVKLETVNFTSIKLAANA